MPQIPSPKPGLDTEAINRQRAKWESQQRLNPNQKLNAEGNPDPNGFTSFDEAAKSLYGDAYAPTGQNIISLGPDGKLMETPASQTHKVIELDKQGNLVEKLVDASGRQIGGSTTSATSSKASPPKPIQPPSTGKFPTANPSTVSGKPRYVPPGSKIAVS